MTTSNTNKYNNSEIKKKLDSTTFHYDTKKIIQILLAIDEIYMASIHLELNIRSDINKFGEEIVLDIPENKEKLQRFFKIESEVKAIVKNNQYQIESLIKYLSNLIKKEGE